MHSYIPCIAVFDRIVQRLLHNPENIQRVSRAQLNVIFYIITYLELDVFIRRL